MCPAPAGTLGCAAPRRSPALTDLRADDSWVSPFAWHILRHPRTRGAGPVPGNLARSESASGTWSRGIRRLTALPAGTRPAAGITHTGSLRQAHGLRPLLLRPRLDYESHAVALDRYELGALLVAAGLGLPLERRARSTCGTSSSPPRWVPGCRYATCKRRRRMWRKVTAEIGHRPQPQPEREPATCAAGGHWSSCSGMQIGMIGPQGSVHHGLAAGRKHIWSRMKLVPPGRSPPLRIG